MRTATPLSGPWPRWQHADVPPTTSSPSGSSAAGSPSSGPLPPAGAWPSPLSAADVAAAGLLLGGVALDRGGERVWWSEGRPAQGGRVAVVRREADGTRTELAPALDARTRVHEYGGGAWLPVPSGADGGGTGLVLADAATQRWWFVADPVTAAGTAPVALTPETGGTHRYADPTVLPGADAGVLVEEDGSGEEPRRALVRLPLDGSGPVELFSGPRFLAAPRTSPDGTALTWISWEHPDMPWHRTLLWHARTAPDGSLTDVRVLAGDAPARAGGESLVHPGWTPAGDLLVVADRSGWWNLHRVDVATGELTALLPEDAEQGFPPWVFGLSTWAGLPDGRIALVHGSATYALDLLVPTGPAGGRPEPGSYALHRLGLPQTAFAGVVVAAGGTVATIGASPTTPAVVLLVDADADGDDGDGADVDRSEVVQAAGEAPDPAHLPVPVPLTVPSAGGRVVHAHRYPPTSPVAPDPGPVPHVLFVHGGPTAQSQAAFSPEVAYFTSRGLGVVDVQYGGSTGYGRAYREALDGAWGVVDVEDCVAVAEHLVAAGFAPAGRVGIRGGSAGGFTVLAALTGTDAFSAGTSYYGVADLRALAADTHDFESRYLDSLVGPLPAAEDVYVRRAPLSHVDELSCPVLLLQGADDLVVPRAQAEEFAAALRRKGLPHALVVFPGEQHGFRRAENIARALESELSFYGQVWGFEPPGVPVLPLE